MMMATVRQMVTLKGVPPVTRFLCTGQLALFAVGAFLLDDEGTGLALRADHFHRAPWSVLTATFFDTHLLALVINVAVVASVGRYIEHAWSSRQFALFVASVCVAMNTNTALTLLFQDMATMHAFNLVAVSIHGTVGLMAAFTVVFKQLVPEHTVNLFKSLISVRVKHLPFIYVSFFLATFLVFQLYTEFLLAMYGSSAAWVYLRFFKLQDGVRGDLSETFSFASFFPDSLQFLVKPVSRIVYRTVGLTGLWKLLQRSKDLSTPLPRSTSALATNELVEAERRRAVALKALESRLQQVKNQPASSSPSASQDITKSASEQQPQPSSSPTPKSSTKPTQPQQPMAEKPESKEQEEEQLK